jgi:bifunctional DNA-binding transcriptional regulator/antitoxin component of YhaV-PrlF toxin-antitoxin module
MPRVPVRVRSAMALQDGCSVIEPGRGGERLVVFRLKDFAERHGLPSERELEETEDAA